MAQLIKPQIEWTEEKIALLRQRYPMGDKNDLCIKLGIKKKTLKNAAQRFGVKSEKDLNFYKLKFLYDDSILSWYWLGFIMADGCLDKEGELRITLSEKDKGHLIKLAEILKVNVHYGFSLTKISKKIINYCNITCKDSFYGPLILKKLGLNGSAKTYNPPIDIDFKNNDNYLSFMCGFIDGDGTFSKINGKVSFIKLEMHSSCLNFLKLCSEKIYFVAKSSTVGINKRGFSFMKIYRKNDIKNIKEFAIKNNLPILERKWNCVF